MQHRLRKFFLSDLWNFRLSEKKGIRYFGFKWLRVIYLSVRGFCQDKCTLHASSLTYYTLMSLVPILAMSFAVARGFGYQEHLRRELMSRFRDQQLILTELFSFTEKMLEQVRGGIIAGIGFLLLFWSVTQLLSSMEGALNQIWGVKKLRSWRRIAIDYLALMLIGPFLFVLSSSFTVFLVDQLERAIRLLPLEGWSMSLSLFLIHLIPYCLFWLLFTFIYLFMPNTRVKTSAAWMGGLIAGTLYVIVQWGYIHFQIGVSRYGAIYGSFAALPLFLIWLQLSWFLLLLGAEISYALQSLQKYEFETQISKASHSFKRLVSLWIVHLVVKNFLSRISWINRTLLMQQYQIPALLVGPVLDDLIAARILIETNEGIIPARPAEQICISDVIEALDHLGADDFPFLDSKSLAPFESALDQFRVLIESSPANRAMIHVSDSP